jgi:FkbM family methyltransferase
VEIDYAKEIDLLLSESIDSILDRERNTFDRLIAPFKNRVVLFGAGSLGRRCLACLRDAGVEPLAFSDSNHRLWDTSVEGIQVLPPAVAARRFAKSAVFAVTIWSAGHSFSESNSALRALGCSSVIAVSSLQWKFSDHLLPFYSLDLPHKIPTYSEEIRATSGLWTDNESRQEFLGQLKWRMVGDHLALRPPSEMESYFPEDIIALTSDETFIDCGAYDGDTIRSFLKRRGGSFRNLYSFEPDPFNFARLQRFVSGIEPAIAKRIRLFGCAVGSRIGVLQFRANGDEGSSVCEDFGQSVPCVSLDAVLSDVRCSYIKMDVEGLEADALMGARSCLARDRPVLAVCAYHKQHDLWQIPQLIHTLCPDHKLFLRSHATESWQLVCYAVPPARLRADAKRVRS